MSDNQDNQTTQPKPPISSNQPPQQNMSWGCAMTIFGIGVAFLLIVMMIVNADGDDDYDTDSDCNDDYIEMDYNGDGEKDAEDFRIQTEGCD